MTRAEYIEKFIAEFGVTSLAINLRGEHVYLVPIRIMAEQGIKKILQDCDKGVYREVTGTPEADQGIPDMKTVELISVIQGAPAAPIGICKLPDDPLGITRVSLGGDTQEAVYVTYRGKIENAIRLMEITLRLMKEQAKVGEARPPHDPQQN